jgi:hypothetical protein
MQETKFLVTFCNNGDRSQTNFAELTVACSGEAIVNIALAGFGLGRTDIVGTTGAVVDGDRIAIALQGAAEQIAYVDRTYNVLGYKTIPNVEDIHGIALDGTDLICVSTGGNLILKENQGICSLPSEFDAFGLDVEHINDICWANDRLVASKFGASRKRGLRNGCVYDVKSGEVLFDGLNQPHSVFFYDNNIYVVDSLTGSLIEFREGSAFGPKSILKINGYARGLYITDRLILIGSSRRRTTSRKSNLATNEMLLSAEHDRRALQRPGIHVYDRLKKHSIFVDVEQMSDEVYQIIELT